MVGSLYIDCIWNVYGTTWPTAVWLSCRGNPCEEYSREHARCCAVLDRCDADDGGSAVSLLAIIFCGHGLLTYLWGSATTSSICVIPCMVDALRARSFVSYSRPLLSCVY